MECDNANQKSIISWDAHLLNKEMTEMLWKDCADTAERIKADGFYICADILLQHDGKPEPGMQAGKPGGERGQ